MERRWYRSSFDLTSFLLSPLSWIFQTLVFLRRFCYQIKLKKTYHFPVPIIVVGNITVGGTGKTPFVIWLAEQLQKQGFRPGIVSRGVGGRQQQSPRWVETQSDPASVGDEAVLLVNRTQCPLVVGIDRVAAVKELLSKTNCNIVISDDGLQHYRLGRDMEIIIMDGDRGLGNQKMLPAGPLRESPKRLTEVDFVVTQGGLDAHQFLMQLQGDIAHSIQDETQKSLTEFKGTKVHAVAAIGNPRRFFSAFRHQGIQVIEHTFPDHYLFQKNDLSFTDELPIIMTEKDAVKCKKLADHRFWYLPVTTHIDKDLAGKILTKLVNYENSN
jgi:tetraacyldisaccharide 4'-kinase